MGRADNNKVQVTLGELYRRMSADFRAVRPVDHAGCVMPMVVASQADEGPNWKVQALTSFCPFCDSITAMIVAEYSSRFQVRYFPQDARVQRFIAGYYCAAD